MKCTAFLYHYILSFSVTVSSRRMEAAPELTSDSQLSSEIVFGK